MVTIGTGVGTAVLNDGVLVPNAELGHIFVEPPPRRHVGLRRDARGAETSRGSSGRAGSTVTSRSCTQILWPELIVIGGGIVKHADKFLDRIDPDCEVRIAELGNLAGIVGAAVAAGEHIPALTTDRS